MKRAWPTVLGLLIVAAATLSVAAIDFPIEVTDVEVSGNAEIRTRTILGAVPFGRGDEVDRDRLKAASEAIYDLGWFSEVTPEAYEDGRVVFRVVEHPVVEAIEITGNVNEEALVIGGVTLFRGPIVSSGRMRRILRRNDVRVGNVFNRTGLDAALEEILTVYEDRGYALINIPPVEAGRVVRIHVIEGRVSGHEVRGLATVPEHEAMALIEVPDGEVLRASSFQASGAAFSASVFFQGVDVELAPGDADDSVVLVWNLIEQVALDTPVEAEGIDLVGATVYPERLIMANVGDLPAGPIDNYALLHALSAVHDLYYRNGYVMVRFASEGVVNGRLQVRIHEGRIGVVVLEGNDRTSDRVISKGLQIRPGDVLNSSRLAVGYQGLMALGYFDSIDLLPQWVGDEVQLTAAIRETERLGGINGSVSFSPDSGGLVGELDYRQLNLFGSGQDLRFSYSHGLVADESATYEVGYSTVTVFPQFNRVGVDLYRRTDTRAEGDEETRYVTLGGKVDVSYPWADYTDLVLGFKHETVSDVGSDEAELVESLTVGFWFDDVNNPRFPTTGGRRSIAVEKAGGFAPGADFAKLDAEMSWFAPVRIPLPFLVERDQVLATHLFLGWALDAPLSQAYEFGGATTVRGANPDTVQRLAFGNLEYRLKLIEGLTAALFVDGGLDLGSMCEQPFKGSFGIELGIDAAGVHVRLDMSWPIAGDIQWVPTFTFGFGPLF